MISYHLTDNFIYYITKANGFEIRHSLWVIDFRDQSNEGMIDKFKNGAQVQARQHSLSNIHTYISPISLKKLRRHIIRTWSLKWSHLPHCNSNLFTGVRICESYPHLIWYYGLNPFHNELQIMKRWWSEELRVVIKQKGWNYLFILLPHPIPITQPFNKISPLPMGSRTMKILCILITPLQSLNLKPLLQHIFFLVIQRIQLFLQTNYFLKIAKVGGSFLCPLELLFCYFNFSQNIAKVIPTPCL